MSHDNTRVHFYDAKSTSDLNKSIEILDSLYDEESADRYYVDSESISSRTGIEATKVEKWAKLIRDRKQAIIYGPPGTGKTFIAKMLAEHIGGSKGVSELVQFHSAYAYEDFIQGLRPQTVESGALTYKMVKGRFLDFCERADGREAPCVLVIDEINRADLSQVFGELMYLLEYRDEAISLAGGERFSIPENVYIVGTMNTADRSIALVDFALRRRFAFIPLLASDDYVERAIQSYHKRKNTGFAVSGLIEQVKTVNQYIDSKHHSIGPSYFLRDNLGDRIESVWRYEIVPYLDEYFFDQPETVGQFQWERVRDTILRSDSSTEDGEA